MGCQHGKALDIDPCNKATPSIDKNVGLVNRGQIPKRHGPLLSRSECMANDGGRMQ